MLKPIKSRIQTIPTGGNYDCKTEYSEYKNHEKIITLQEQKIEAEN